MKQRHFEQPSKFMSLENHFLNTFFSGLYFSAKDFINIGKKHGIELPMHSREMLIKDLLNKSDENGVLSAIIGEFNALIDEQINTYHRLSLEYPNARVPLAKLAQKCTGTKALLARESRGNPYEY